MTLSTNPPRPAGKHAYAKPASPLEVVFRCLAVGLFFVFVFVIVPRLGDQQGCRTSLHGNKLETMEDLRAYLLLLAEEQSHDAEQAKHIFSLAQQLGGGGDGGGGGSFDSSTASATTTATSQQQQQQQQQGEAVSNTTGAAAAAAAGAADATTLHTPAAPMCGTPTAHLITLVQRTKAELATAKLVIRKHEQLLQTQVQETQQLQAQLQQLRQRPLQQPQQQPEQQQQQLQPASHPASTLQCGAGVVESIAMLGNACGVLPGTELGGEVVIWGAQHRADTAGECCAACLAHQAAVERGVGSEAGKAGKACNVWVHCGDAAACGDSYRECWLKHQPDAATLAAAVSGSGSGSMWTSGVPVRGSVVTPWQATQLGLPPPSAAVVGAGAQWLGTLTADTTPALLWSTPLGVIRVQLLPELAPSSVQELVRLAALLTVYAGGRCSNCRIYRAEPGFLVQGVIEVPGAYVSVPRQPNPPQRRVMGRGLVCWAGGGGGPDWFVNMIEQSGFGDSHLCWGQVDGESLGVFERILQQPVKPKGGADSVEMVLLQQEVRFNCTLDPPAAAAGRQSAEAVGG